MQPASEHGLANASDTLQWAQSLAWRFQGGRCSVVNDMRSNKDRSCTDRGYPWNEEDGRMWAEGLQQQLPSLYHPVHMRALVQIDVGIQDQHDAAGRQPAQPSAPISPDVIHSTMLSIMFG